MTTMAFTTDSKILLMAGDDGAVRYLSMEGRGDVLTLLLTGLGAGVRTMEFNRDGTILALGLEDNRIALVDYENQTVLISLEGHTRQLTNLTWLEDDSFLVSSSADGSVRFWGVR